MTSNKAFSSGVIAGLFLALAAEAGHWLITPMSHPNASPAQHTGVVIQAIGCLAVAAWLAWRQEVNGRRAV